LVSAIAYFYDSIF